MQRNQSAPILPSMLSREPKVSVCVVTYNQEKYIGECLKSIVEQEVSFDFEVIIGDDCSTDGTREVISSFKKEYPQKIKTIFNEKNIGPTANYRKVHSSALGEYISHLDGDDYMLPGKLQKQVNYLDAHPECAVAYHRVKVLDEKSGCMVDDLIDVATFPPDGFKRNDILAIGSIGCHSSKMYRSCAMNIHYPFVEVLDYHVFVENLQYGNVGYLNEILGVYRANVGMMRNGDAIRKLLLTHLVLFFKKYPECKSSISAHVIRLFLGDLLKKRGSLRFSFNAALKTFHPFFIYWLLRNRKYLRQFRSPVA